MLYSSHAVDMQSAYMYMCMYMYMYVHAAVLCIWSIIQMGAPPLICL